MTDFHPIADIMPALEGAEFSALCDDIKANGLREPITLHNGKILDGRNRYRACRETGVPPRYTKYEGDDPLGFVISLNLKRRHMNESQRAMVAAKIANWRVGDNQFKGSSIELPSISQQSAAAMLNVGAASVKRAATVRACDDPDLTLAVEIGRLPVSAAASLAKKDEKFRASILKKLADDPDLKVTEASRLAHKEALPDKVAVLPDGIFRVLYADPPWQYNDQRQTGDHRQSTGAFDHYATMTLDELKALDVKSIAAPDSVLFMWGTFPLMQEGLDSSRRGDFPIRPPS